MAEGLSYDLFWAALTTGLLGYLVARRTLSIPVALSVTYIKIGIPFVYFAWFFDGTWTMVDDFKVISDATAMIASGYTSISALSNADGILQMSALARGPHILYIWWNQFAFYIFGQHYYSPIFLNILVTFIAGYFMHGIIKETVSDKQYLRWYQVFFLLHWDILAWSSFANLKDVLIATISIIFMYFVVQFSQVAKWRHLVGMGLALFLMFWGRYYMVAILGVSAMSWIFLFSGRKLNKTGLYIFVIIGVILFAPYAFSPTTLAMLNPGKLIYGLIRFPLTPRPWAVPAAYSFIIFPSIIHWVLFLPAVYTGWRIWQQSTIGKLLILFMIINLTFFALVPDLQNNRKRLSFTMIITWMQFHFLWSLAWGAVHGYRRGQISLKATVTGSP